MVRCTYPNTAPDVMAKIKQNWGAALAKHGFVDGQNLEIEVLSARSQDWVGDPEWKAIARRVVDSRPDVVVVEGFWVEHFEALTRDIPIVFTWMIDPEYFGSIQTARRPGRNITGNLIPFFECQAKRLEMLKSLRPDARRAAVVAQPGGDKSLRIEDKFRESASRLGLEGMAVWVQDPRIPGAVTTAVRNAKIDLADFLFGTELMPREEVAQLVKLGVAMSSTVSTMVEDGALLFYNVETDYSITESMVVRILRGEPVSSMPAQQSNKFGLILNLRVARAMGLQVPRSLILQAQKVYE